jgi:YbbR domain-containing protein
VNAVVTGTPDPAVEITGVDVEPVLVTVEGEADALAGVVSIDTRPVSVSGATTDIDTQVGLALPEGVAALGVDQVQVVITIRPRSGTRTFEAGLEIVNANPDLEYRPAVDRVLLTVGGTLEALDAVDPTRIVARLDVAGLGPGTSAVTVTVQLPPGVSLVSASPPEVSVTATPVATPTPAPTPQAGPGESPSPSPAP